jgi:hypothetical protein
VADIAAGEIRGLQLSGTVALARSVYGIQASVISVTWDDVHGAQIGVVSYAEDVSGLQAGVIPVASGEVRGLQWGMISVAGGEMAGAQLGVINWSTRTDGLMVGLINLGAEGADSTPIGLINIFGDGKYQPMLWTDEASMVNAGLKMGSRKAYSILGVGFAPFGGKDGMNVMAGVGGRIPLRDPLWLEIDIIGQSLVEEFKAQDGLDLLSKVRGTLGFQFFDWLAVYGGVSLNLLVSDQREHGGPAWLRLWADHRGDTFLDLGLGLFLGVQI